MQSRSPDRAGDRPNMNTSAIRRFGSVAKSRRAHAHALAVGRKFGYRGKDQTLWPTIRCLTDKVGRSHPAGTDSGAEALRESSTARLPRSGAIVPTNHGTYEINTPKKVNRRGHCQHVSNSIQAATMGRAMASGETNAPRADWPLPTRSSSISRRMWWRQGDFSRQ